MTKHYKDGTHESLKRNYDFFKDLASDLMVLGVFLLLLIDLCRGIISGWLYFLVLLLSGLYFVCCIATNIVERIDCLITARIEKAEALMREDIKKILNENNSSKENL